MDVRRIGNRPFQAYVDKKGCLSWTVDAAPCEAVCPLGIDIEGYIRAIAQGDFDRAIGIIREKCPLLSVCGRVCHHPCEAECKRGKIDEPLAIMELKSFVSNHEHEKELEAQSQERREKEVAIIGSGPAGLMAAYDLAQKGYGVTIYEALPVAGGMLATGIPEFILPQDVLQRDIDYITSLGVEIKTNIRIGKDLPFSDIWTQGFKAVLVAAGAWQSLQLPVPGVDLEDVIYALPLLKETKLGKKRSLPGTVVVIGGGNVAIDAARTVLRLGAGEVHVYCLESRENIPAFEWEIASAEAEGVILHPSQAPQELRSTGGIRVTHVDFKAVASCERDKDGKVVWALEEGPDSDSSIETDWVIIAIGQTVDLSAMGDLGLSISPRGAIIVDRDTMATNVPGIFAAGDVVEVAGTVTESMAAGRRAAMFIDNYLKGRELREGLVTTAEPRITGATTIPTGIAFEERQKMPTLSPEESIKGFQEAKLGFSLEQAVGEAKRCLECKTCHRCVRNWDCVAITWAENGPKLSPYISSYTCGGCGVCIRECPFDQIYAGDLID